MKLPGLDQVMVDKENMTAHRFGLVLRELLHLEFESKPMRQLMEDLIVIADAMAAAHDRRVTDLLTANNREVEARRRAEARVAELVANEVLPTIEATLRFISEVQIDVGFVVPGHDGLNYRVSPIMGSKIIDQVLEAICQHAGVAASVRTS
jgi:hypothetical protein